MLKCRIEKLKLKICLKNKFNSTEGINKEIILENKNIYKSFLTQNLLVSNQTFSGNNKRREHVSIIQELIDSEELLNQLKSKYIPKRNILNKIDESKQNAKNDNRRHFARKGKQNLKTQLTSITSKLNLSGIQECINSIRESQCFSNITHASRVRAESKIKQLMTNKPLRRPKPCLSNISMFKNSETFVSLISLSNKKNEEDKSSDEDEEDEENQDKFKRRNVLCLNVDGPHRSTLCAPEFAQHPSLEEGSKLKSMNTITEHK